MRGVLAALLATLVVAQSAVLRAQQATPVPSVESLGVSFDRIRRQLDQKPAAKDKTGLKLEFYIEVVAEAPPFQLFAPGESSFGVVPGVAPSHADMMRHITPQAFSAPAATLASFGGSRGTSPKLMGQDFWENQSRQAKEVARRKKVEEERERQRRLKESVVVSPPKVPGGPGAAAPRP
jgi:hypothetical protein